MASYDTQKELLNEYLDAVRTSQGTVIQAVRSWVDVVQSVAPKGLVVPLSFAEPPKPEEVVETTYDFAAKLLADQRQFVEEWVKATVPLMRENREN
jgi:hypothetical protein